MWVSYTQKEQVHAVEPIKLGLNADACCLNILHVKTNDTVLTLGYIKLVRYVKLVRRVSCKSNKIRRPHWSLIKVHLTPNIFFSPQKTPCAPDYNSERIIIIRLVFDFL